MAILIILGLNQLTYLGSIPDGDVYNIALDSARKACVADVAKDVGLNCFAIELESVQHNNLIIKRGSPVWEYTFNVVNLPSVWRFDIELDSTGKILDQQAGYQSR